MVETQFGKKLWAHPSVRCPDASWLGGGFTAEEHEQNDGDPQRLGICFPSEFSPSALLEGEPQGDSVCG